jgi:polyisoprenoid-binding protein YceI
MHMMLAMLVAFCFAFPHATNAQAQARIVGDADHPRATGIMGDADRPTSYSLDSNSVIHLNGTSTLHNWTMTAHSFTGTANVTFNTDHQLSSITGFSLRLPVRNLKGENSGMEKSTYKALKEDKFKDIVFELASASFIKSGSEHYLVLLHGNLTMAGVTRPTTLKASAQINEDGTILCSGELPVYMSNYDIERPTYLLGTMKVGDLLLLTYNLLLVK